MAHDVTTAVSPSLNEAGWEKVEDCTLYWTMSLYIDNDAPGYKPLREQLTPLKQREIQRRVQDSDALRNAMEPLFNDIADRERLGKVEDFLLDVPGNRSQEITIETPASIAWTTEGVEFKVQFASATTRSMRMRQFWYVHRNGGLSYHVSFSLRYEHTAEDLFHISLLQKALAPKEFAAYSGKDRKMTSFPLEEVKVTHDGEVKRFWDFVKHLYRTDIRALLTDLDVTPGRDPWCWVTKGNFIEVPELGDRYPSVRFLFVFNDAKMFHLLKGRRDAVSDADFMRYPQLISELVATGTTKPTAELGTAYWEEIASKAPHDASGNSLYTDHLLYLFMAGFNQNIIDFMNQDASEVLDSTDPLYPATPAQADESFFFRFANPRAIISYVQKSRSLEVGNDWIGTCPYVFLIHVLALHNEFLARDYEDRANKLVDEVNALNQNNDLKNAANTFYKFNRERYVEYKRHRYANVFRYDTERDMFESLERVRGTDRKTEYMEALIQGLQDQTRDLEGRVMNDETRLMNEEARFMNKFLVVITAFGILQVLLALHALYDQLPKDIAKWSSSSWCLFWAYVSLTAIAVCFTGQYSTQYWKKFLRAPKGSTSRASSIGHHNVPPPAAALESSSAE